MVKIKDGTVIKDSRPDSRAGLQHKLKSVTAGILNPGEDLKK
jgi:hypothetical protein